MYKKLILILMTILCSLNLSAQDSIPFAEIDVVANPLGRKIQYSKSDSKDSDAAIELLYSNLNLQIEATFQNLTLIESDDNSDENIDSYILELSHPQTSLFQMLLRGPKGFLTDGKAYGVTFVTAGFITGQKSAQLLPIENEIVVGFNYPTTLEKIAQDPSLFLKTIRITPAQIALSLKYLSQQSYIDSSSFTVVGVSLGGLFLPVSLRLAERLNFIPSRGTIFGYSGGNISLISSNVLKNTVSESAQTIISSLLEKLTKTHAPELHAPFLSGPFLVIDATEDQVFPKESQELLWNSLSENQIKLRKEVQGPHIDEGRTDMILETQAIVKEWLKKISGKRI